MFMFNDWYNKNKKKKKENNAKQKAISKKVKSFSDMLYENIEKNPRFIGLSKTIDLTNDKARFNPSNTNPFVGYNIAGKVKKKEENKPLSFREASAMLNNSILKPGTRVTSTALQPNEIEVSSGKRENDMDFKTASNILNNLKPGSNLVEQSFSDVPVEQTPKTTTTNSGGTRVSGISTYHGGSNSSAVGNKPQGANTVDLNKIQDFVFNSNKNYNELARQEYDVVYNMKLNALKNKIRRTLDTLKNMRDDIDETYDDYIDRQERNNKIMKNNYSNEMLNRGLGRSSIATTGLAGMDDRNNRIIREIEDKRADALENLSDRIATAKENYEDTLNTMEAVRADAIAKLAKELEQKDYNRALQEYKLKRDEYWKQKDYELDLKKLNNSIRRAGGKSISSKEFKKFTPTDKDLYYNVTDRLSEIDSNPDMTTKEKIEAKQKILEEIQKDPFLPSETTPDVYKKVLDTVVNSIKSNQDYRNKKKKEKANAKKNAIKKILSGKGLNSL